MILNTFLVIFYILSSQLFYNENPDTLPHPTPAHFLIKLLQNHHVMTRLYTQNIDGKLYCWV